MNSAGCLDSLHVELNSLQATDPRRSRYYYLRRTRHFWKSGIFDCFVEMLDAPYSARCMHAVQLA